MDRFDEILNKHFERCQHTKDNIQRDSIVLGNRARNVADFLRDTSNTLSELDKEFEARIGLSASEVKLLFIVAAMQVLRHVFVTKFPLSGNSSNNDNIVEGDLYNPSVYSISYNPVPYDLALDSTEIHIGPWDALAHDPICSLIIGTANIATSTLTSYNFESFHITFIDESTITPQPAETYLVLMHTIQKLCGSNSDRMKVATAFFKSLLYLKTDSLDDKNIPFPTALSIDEKYMSKLDLYGVETSGIKKVSQQVAYATLINYLASIYHYSLYDGVTDEVLYRIKTEKIITYSNIIASSINLAVFERTKDIKNLDLGGISVAIYKTITNVKFIKQVKRDFVLGKYNSMFADL